MVISAYKDIFEDNGIALTEEQSARLEKYADMLVEYNKMVNLTAITDDDGIAVKHFFDSIFPFTLLTCPRAQS